MRYFTNEGDGIYLNNIGLIYQRWGTTRSTKLSQPFFANRKENKKRSRNPCIIIILVFVF
jgi:hypothetical protein